MPWIPLKYFTADELDSPDAPGTGEQMDSTFMLKLDQLRLMCGFPFIITSGFRTPLHNKKVGGVTDSAHTRGIGVDIETRGSEHRYKLVSNALMIGFQRIGIARTYTHIDDDKTKPEGVIWLY